LPIFLGKWEIEELPEPLLEEVLPFVRFLKSQASKEKMEAALLSQTASRKD
jgi:hypothetical protein